MLKSKYGVSKATIKANYLYLIGTHINTTSKILPSAKLLGQFLSLQFKAR